MRCFALFAFYSLVIHLPLLMAETEDTSLPKVEGTKMSHDQAKAIYDKTVELILPNGKYRADDHSGNDILKNLKSKGVPPEFAVLMRPEDDPSFESRRQYVMVMAEFEPPSRQLALIDKLASEHPDDHDLSALQLVASPASRRSALIQKMARDPKNDLRALEERLPPLLQYDPAGYRAMLNNWRMVVDLFSAIPPELHSEKCIYSYDPVYLMLNGWADHIGIPPLLPSLPVPTPTPEQSALALQRNDTIQAVATAMLGQPCLSYEAFAILHHGRDVFHLNGAALRKIALRSCQLILRDEDQICRKESHELGIFVNFRPKRFSDTRLDRSNQCSAGVSPYGYLLDHALKTKKFHDSSEFLECFSKENRKTLKAGLDFFKNPTLSRAKTMLPQWVADDEPIPAPQLALYSAIAGLCGINTNKGFTTLLDATEFSEPSDLYYQQIEILAVWANVCLEHRNIKQLATVIQNARQRFLGKNLRYDKLSGDDALGEVFDRIHSPHGDCSLIRVRLSTRGWEKNRVYADVPDIFLPESPADSAKILLASRLFLPGPGMFDHDENRNMISSSDDLGFLPFAVVGYRPKEEASAIEESSLVKLGRELLKIDGPERFWARITGAYLAKQDATIVIPEVERELSIIKTWPAPEQQALAKFLLTRWPALHTESLTPWLKQTNIASPMGDKSD